MGFYLTYIVSPLSTFLLFLCLISKHYHPKPPPSHYPNRSNANRRYYTQAQNSTRHLLQAVPETSTTSSPSRQSAPWAPSSVHSRSSAKASVGITGNEVAGAAAPICEGVVDVDGVVCAGAKGEGLRDGEGGIGGGTSGEEGGIEGGSVGCGAGGGFEGAAGGLKAVGRGAEDVGDGPGREARFEGGAGKRGGCADWGRGCG